MLKLFSSLLLSSALFAQSPTDRINADIAKLTAAVQQTAASVAALKAQVANMSAPMASQLGDFALTYGPTQFSMTIGAQCSQATPCNVRLGSVVVSFKVPIAVKSAFGLDNSNSSLVFVYIDNQGVFTIGSATLANLQCDGVCHAVMGVTSFPTDSIPLWRFTVTNGQITQDAEDFRAFLSAKNVDASAGVLITEQGSSSAIGLDSTLTMIRSAVPATATDSCIAGQFATDAATLYLCIATDSWIRLLSIPWTQSDGGVPLVGPVEN